jgi:acetyl-CoA carboxylase carboxyltransferase component
VLNLTESGGADLPNQARIFIPGGMVFRELTSLSAAGIPTITLVFGSAIAGGAYMPGMSDYTIFVKGAAKVFLGGPPLVKMAIDEDADEEVLGGAEMHARESGLADYLAVDEMDAIRLGRQVVARLNWHKQGPGPTLPVSEPLYAREELLGCAAADTQMPVDAREILARVLDGSDFDEFKPLYGTTLVTGWGSIHGFPVGVLANNGVLFSEEAQKGAQFVQLCNFRAIPLIFVQNVTGFMVGTRYEKGGIIKDGAKLINAVANSTVPHITLMVGASYGAGNYGMSGRAYGPRFVFTWPNHRIAVMGGKQLGGVMSIVRRAAAAHAGHPYDEGADAALRQTIEGQIDRESNALYATGHLWDDGIIDPRDTRTVLGIALSVTHSAPVKGATSYAPFRM